MKLRNHPLVFSLFSSVWLGLIIGTSSANAQSQSLDTAVELPKAFSRISPTSVQHYQLPVQNGANGSRYELIKFDGQEMPSLKLPIPGSEVQLRHSHRHANGDITVSGTVTIDGLAYQLILTQGRAGSIGELQGVSNFWLQQQGNQFYVADLAGAGLVEPGYHNDVKLPLSAATSSKHIASFAPTIQQVEGQDITVVDIMMLYASEVTAVYPNGLAETLMTQLVAKANQAFVDSGVSMQLRLVHRQQVNYLQPSNFIALDDLQNALDKNYTGVVEGSLAQVAALREQYGADIVSMIRIHDLNERGVCGIAFFPQSANDVLVNISNVGVSGGSICGNTFTHEIGHNFGAGHQFVNGNSVGARPTAGALIVPGKFNTVMSSIGTGDINRNYSLNRFSNPELICAGVSCGDQDKANNASAINYFSTINASLRPEVSKEVVTPPPASNPDTDGDGSTDLNDRFPFDIKEQLDSDGDGVGDNADSFPNNSSEQLDFDKDGIGNNNDPDDDNDGVADIDDALPFDPSDSIDRDSDGVGDKTDELPVNFQDFRDSDKDGIGNRFDADNDNDGVPDYDPRANGKQQLLVVNAGSGQILALNPADGKKIETLYQAPQGGFSFRSDLVNLSPSQVGFVQFSDILRLDRQSKTTDVLLKRASLATAFSVGLLKTGDTQEESRLWVSSGLNPSAFEHFSFANNGTKGSSDKLRSENIWRDLLLANGNILMAVRDTNQILSINPNRSSLQSTVWAQGSGLNKPEQLALLPDGNILVTNAASRNVSRFSASGQYLGEFISAGSAGLTSPSCIAVDNVGNVYICSTSQNKILKFSSNGAPLSEFASAETVGLDQPVSLLFTGDVLDTAPMDPTNDSDGDGVANNRDAYPLDPSRSAAEPTAPPATEDKSGGATGLLALGCLALFAWLRRRQYN